MTDAWTDKDVRWAERLVRRRLGRLGIEGPVVDDLVQEALLRLCKHAERFQPSRGVPFRKWLSPQLRRAVVDAIRARCGRYNQSRVRRDPLWRSHSLSAAVRSGHRGTGSDANSRLDGNSTFADVIPSDTPDPSKIVAERDAFVELAREIEEECVGRECDIVRAFVAGATTQTEVAEQLGVTLGTVHYHIKRIRHKLQFLEGDGKE